MANQVDANDRRVRYVWTTGTQVFDYDFPLSSAANIAVYINASATPADPSTYTVDLVAKTVTYIPALTVGNVVVLEGLETLTRTDGYPLRGGLPSSLLNGDVNNLYYALQEMRRDINRALVLVKSAPNTVNPTIPAPVANAVIVGNSDATGFATGPLTTDVAAVALHLTQIDNVSADLTNINTVAGDLSSINTVAGAIANVNATGAAIIAVAAVAADLTNINAVQAGLTNINTVAGVAANVTTVAGISANVTTVAGDHTVITTVAGDHTVINTVAGDHTAINTVAGDHTAIGTVAGDHTVINTVSGIAANVTTVAGISANVTTVAGISANVTTVAGISANVTTVAGDHTAITTVAGDHTIINTVAGDHASIVAIAADLTNIDTCATNIAAINAAPAAATAAAASAASAAAAASGISMRGSCRVASTAALTVTYANGTSGVGATLTNAGAQAALAIDGVTLALNERVLVKDQASGFQNGLYTATTLGDGTHNWVLTRTTDYDEAAEIVEGTATIIEEGTTNSSHIFVMTHHGAITVGTTSIDFTALTANATSANTLTTPRTIYGNNFDGSAALNQVIASAYGGTGNGFAKLSGPASTEKTFTLPNASATILTDNTLVSIAQGGTGANALTNHGVVVAGASALSTVAPGSSGNVLKSNGTDWISGAAAGGGGGYRALSSTDTVIASDNGKTLTIAGTCALALTAAATVGNFSCFVQNTATSGTQVITITPNGAENLDGSNTTLIMLPGEVRELNCNATAWVTEVVVPFTLNITTTVTPTLPRNGYIGISGQVWGGGGSGGTGATNGGGGGGGGGYQDFIFQTGGNGGGVSGGGALAGVSIVCTVGAGGIAQVSANTAGNAGGISSVQYASTFMLGYAFGGGAGGGSSLGSGGGGGSIGWGYSSSSNPGTPITSGVGGNAVTTTAGVGGVSWDQHTGAAASTAPTGLYGGAGGGNSTNAGAGASAYKGGGGGGAGIAGTGGAGGASLYGGAGGGGGGSSSGGTGGQGINGGNGGNGRTGSTAGQAGGIGGGGGGGSVTGTSGAGGAGLIVLQGII